MNDSLTFEAEAFEFSTREQPAESCGCAKCRTAQHRSEGGIAQDEFESGQDEASEDFVFEEEFSDEVPLLQKGVAAKALQVAATARARQAIAVRQGSTGEKVCWVQNVLNQAEGESLKIDGIFGPLTRGATLRFQSRHGLQVDGIVGKQTETALIQTGLNTIAQASLVGIDGVMNVRTQQEIRRFQSQQRLVVDGIVGPITRGAMITALGGRRCPVRATPRPVPPPPPPVPRPPTPNPPPPQPPPTPGCNRTELARRVDACIADTKRCAIEAGQDLALALAACKLNPVCNAAAVGKSLLALKRCREALLRCDAAAKASTNCT